MTSRLTRRGFLKHTAALAGAAAAQVAGGPFVLAEAAPSSKLACAVIGSNGQGMASVGAAAGERIVALADADDKRLAATMKELADKRKIDTSGIKTYFDYRRLFDEMAKDIDVCFVATPDHHHAPASMRAIKLGKHVFCEKPLAHSIQECRALAEAAKQHNVRTQMGNQGHCGDGYRRLCEYIWAGAIGNVVETHTWIGMVNGGTGGRPASQPVPAGLHWDEWLGPAPVRDYHGGLHPGSWRSWWDFGNGTLGDWACHQIDGVFWALKLGHATSVEALELYGGSDERYPVGSSIRYEFPARGDLPPVKVHWYDGMKADKANPSKQVPVRPALVAEFEQKYNRQFDQSWGGGGTLYIGDKGVMYTGNYGSGPRILPEEKHKAFPVPPESLPRIRGGHFADFLRACRDGKPSAADFSYAGPFTEMVLLGQLAMKAGIGKKVEWDGAAMTARHMPELDRLIKREHRKGWEL
jgi:predicted dehydrogenase